MVRVRVWEWEGINSEGEGVRVWEWEGINSEGVRV